MERSKSRIGVRIHLSYSNVLNPFAHNILTEFLSISYNNMSTESTKLSFICQLFFLASIWTAVVVVFNVFTCSCPPLHLCVDSCLDHRWQKIRCLHADNISFTQSRQHACLNVTIFLAVNVDLVWIFGTVKLNRAICLIQIHTLAGTLVMGVYVQQKTTFPLGAEAVLWLADSVPRRTHLRPTTCAYTSFCSTPVNVHNLIGKTTDSCNTINHICANYSRKCMFKIF